MHGYITGATTKNAEFLSEEQAIDTTCQYGQTPTGSHHIPNPSFPLTPLTLLLLTTDSRADGRPRVMPDASAGAMEEALPFDSKEVMLYPVSMLWQPPFTVMVDLWGRGELQVSWWCPLPPCSLS